MARPIVESMLICAEVLLVATRADGRAMAGKSRLDLALAGGVLCELAACERVAVSTPTTATVIGS